MKKKLEMDEVFYIFNFIFLMAIIYKDKQVKIWHKEVNLCLK